MNNDHKKQEPSSLKIDILKAFITLPSYLRKTILIVRGNFFLTSLPSDGTESALKFDQPNS